MKNILIILSLLFLSCDNKYTLIEQEVIEGKISATEKGHAGRFASLPKIYIQTPRTVREINIPLAYEHKWKVGDTCILIIEKYRENE